MSCSDAGYTQYALPDCAAAGDAVIGYTARNLDIWSTDTRVGIYTQDGVFCSGILIDGVTFRNSLFLGFHFDTTPSATTGGFRDITLKNVRGNIANTYAMCQFGSTGTMSVESFTADGIFPSNTVTGAYFYASPAVTIKNIAVSNWTRPRGATGAMFSIASGAAFDNLLIENFIIEADVTSSSAFAVYIGNVTSPGSVVFNQGILNTTAGSSGTCCLLQTTNNPPSYAAAKGIKFKGRSTSWDNLSTSTTAKMTFENCVLDGGFSLWTTGNPAFAIVVGGNSISSTQGVFNFYGAGVTYSFSVTGFDFNGNTFMTNYGAGSTYNVYGPTTGAPLDLTKVTMQTGALAYNSNAAFGTGVGIYAKGPTTATRIAA